MQTHQRIKLRHLRTFVEIARRGALKHTAKELNMTQPAVSKVLKDLEDILGYRLVERNRSGASLTEAGELFLQYAEQSLATLHQGLTSLSAMQTGAAGQLRVGALPSVAARLLPFAARRFREVSPGALLIVEQGSHQTLVSRLRSGELDLVVGRLGAPETMTGLSFTQIYSERVACVVGIDHPLANSARLEDILDWPVIYPPRNAAIRPLVDRLFLAKGLGVPSDRLESVSHAFGRAMALGPMRAVWLISEGVVAGDILAGVLRLLDIDTSSTSGPVGFMARSEEEETPISRLFRSAMMKSLADVPMLWPAAEAVEPGV